jgi:transcriptional regulator with XRE-family HTH domain
VAKERQTRPETLEQACGRVIAELREEQGLSQMDLAVATGYSLRYIGDVERGAKSATLRTMKDLATLLNLRLGDLISRAERLLKYRDKENRAKVQIPKHIDKAR